MPEYDNEDFLAMAGFVEELAELDYYLAGQFEEQTMATRVQQVTLESPCQLDVTVDEEGKVSIGAIPPMYYLSTSFMPVFHHIKMTIDTTVNDQNQ